MLEKRSTGSNTKYNSSLRGTTSMGPKKTKDNFSVSMVSTRSGTENKTKEGAKDKQVEPTIEIDLETPVQSVDEVEKKTTESTPMPHMEDQNPKTDRRVGRHNRQYPRNCERRLSSIEDIFYRKVGDDGRNEIERQHGRRIKN